MVETRLRQLITKADKEIYQLLVPLSQDIAMFSKVILEERL
jgi:hypothetical protein